MGKHTLVYLDQNYLSNMAKARHGLIRDEADGQFWSQLFADLQKAVFSDRIACPKSGLHEEEMQFDARLEGPIREVLDGLSWGLHFRPWQDILESQIECAACEFLKLDCQPIEDWAVAFRTDPHAPVETRMHDVLGRKGRINVHMSLPPDFVAHDRNLKDRYVEGAESITASLPPQTPDDLERAIARNKHSLLDNYLGEGASVVYYI